MTKQWPERHPELGEPLGKRQVAARLGCGPNNIDVLATRTRAGALRVPFPDPDDYAMPPEGRRQLLPYWWEATIAAYMEAANRSTPKESNV